MCRGTSDGGSDAEYRADFASSEVGRRAGLLGRLKQLIPWALLALGPLVPLSRVMNDPSRYLPGVPLGDIYKHVWSFWHTPASLALGSWPRTPFIAAPDGGVILDAMLIPSLVMWPVEAVFGPVLAINIWIGISLFAAGAATFALARELTRSTTGAVCAGLVVQTCPFLLGYPLTSGVTERLAIWAFPLVLLALLRVRRGGGWRWPIVAVLPAAFVALSSPAYAVFLAVLVLAALPMLIAPDDGRSVRQMGLRLAPTLVAMLAVFGVSLLVVRWLFHHPDAVLHAPAAGRLGMSLGMSSEILRVATPSLLLWPTAVHAQEPLLRGDVLYNLYYLGWVPLLAVIAGGILAARRRRYRVLFVVALAILFACLAMGPTVGPLPINLPYMALCYLIPGYGSIPYPWQQVALFESLAPVGLAMVVGAIPRPALRLGLAALLLGAVVGERALVLPVPLSVWTTEARVSSVYDAVDQPGPLIDLPLRHRLGPLYPGAGFLAQTRHGQPITSSIDHGTGRWDFFPAANDGLTRSWPSAFACFSAGGVRWIAIHRDRIDDQAEVRRCLLELAQAGVSPVADDGNVMLFDTAHLPPGAASPSPDCPAGARSARPGRR